MDWLQDVTSIEVPSKFHSDGASINTVWHFILQETFVNVMEDVWGKKGVDRDRDDESLTYKDRTYKEI